MIQIKAKIIIPIVIVLLLATAVGGYFLLMRNQTPSQEEIATSVAEVEVAEEEGEIQEVREVVIVARDYEFSPAEVTAEPGETIRVVLRNEGKMQHDWVLEGTDFRTELVSPGEEATVEVTLDEADEYAFYCSVPGHRALGMEGTLTVQ